MTWKRFTALVLALVLVLGLVLPSFADDPDTPGETTTQTDSETTGTQGTEDPAGNGSDDRSDDGSDDQSDDGSDDQSGDGSDNQSGDGSDDGSDDQSGDGSDDQSDNGSDNQSDDGSDNQSDDGSDDQSDDGSDNQSDDGEASLTDRLAALKDWLAGLLARELLSEKEHTAILARLDEAAGWSEEDLTSLLNTLEALAAAETLDKTALWDVLGVQPPEPDEGGGDDGNGGDDGDGKEAVDEALAARLQALADRIAALMARGLVSQEEYEEFLALRAEEITGALLDEIEGLLDAREEYAALMARLAGLMARLDDLLDRELVTEEEYAEILAALEEETLTGALLDELEGFLNERDIDENALTEEEAAAYDAALEAFQALISRFSGVDMITDEEAEELIALLDAASTAYYELQYYDKAWRQFDSEHMDLLMEGIALQELLDPAYRKQTLDETDDDYPPDGPMPVLTAEDEFLTLPTVSITVYHPGPVQVNPYGMRLSTADGGTSTGSITTNPGLIVNRSGAAVDVTAWVYAAPKSSDGGVSLVGRSTRYDSSGTSVTRGSREIFLFLELQNVEDEDFGGAQWKTTPRELGSFANYTNTAGGEIVASGTVIPDSTGRNYSKPGKLKLVMPAPTGSATETYAAYKIGGDCSVPSSSDPWLAPEGFLADNTWRPDPEQADGAEITIIFRFVPRQTFKLSFTYLEEEYPTNATITSPGLGDVSGGVVLNLNCHEDFTFTLSVGKKWGIYAIDVLVNGTLVEPLYDTIDTDVDTPLEHSVTRTIEMGSGPGKYQFKPNDEVVLRIIADPLT